MGLHVNSHSRQLQPSRIASYSVASALKPARSCVAATEPSRRQERLDTSIRNKWASGDPKGPQKPIVDRSTRRLANQTTAKSVIAKALISTRLPGAVKEGRKIENCFIGCYSDENGDIRALIRFCRSRWCSVCSARINSKLAKELQAAINLTMKENQELTIVAGTLTANPLCLPKNGRDCGANLATFQKRWRRFTKTLWFKENVLGTYWRIEVQKREGSDYFNVHLHFIAFTGLSKTAFERGVNKEWTHGFSKIKKFQDRKVGKSVQEFVKYVCKALAVKSGLASIVRAFFNKRVYGTTGLLRDALKRYRKSNKSVPEVDSDKVQLVPVPPFNDTGDELPKGAYSFLDMLKLYRETNKPIYKHCLELIKYRFKWGNLYETIFGIV